MELYVSVYIALIVLSIIEITFTKQNSQSVVTVRKASFKIPLTYAGVFIVLYYILSLRKFTGTDTYVYYRMFNITSLQSDIEEGFRWLMQITQNFGGDFFEFEKVVALVTLIPIMLTIYYFSPFPLYSSLIFFSAGCYFGLFNTMRQGVALGLTFFSLTFLLFSAKNFYVRWSIALPIILVSTLFHTTAFFIIFELILIILFRKCLEKNPNTVWFFYALICGTFVTKIDLLQIIFRLATSIPIGDFANKYISLYGGSNYLSNNSSGVLLINFFLILILFIINFPRISESKVALNIAAILGVYLILLSTRNGAQLYTRIIYYMDILLVVIFPVMLKDSFKHKQYVYLTIFVQIMYILFNFLRMILLNYNGIMPYGIEY